MVSINSILHCPSRPSSLPPFPIWPYHDDRNLHSSATRGPPSSLCFLTFEQNQRTTYREVLITGDLSPDDISRATERTSALKVSWPTWIKDARSNHTQDYARLWTLLPYGRNPPDTSAELALENDTVYFAPPSSSQLAPGGQGFGTFDTNQTSISQKGNPNDTLALLINGRSSAGSILRFVLPPRQISTSY